MIKREDLKKGDHVLEVASFYSQRDSNHITELVVVSIGSKYIGCQQVYSGGEVGGSVRKYSNDERMGLKDWGQWKLFLGTKEEYQQELENQKKCSDLYREISNKLNRDLGYEKLSAINTIIDADTLDDALATMHCVRLPK